MPEHGTTGAARPIQRAERKPELQNYTQRPIKMMLMGQSPRSQLAVDARNAALGMLSFKLNVPARRHAHMHNTCQLQDIQ